MSFRLVGIGMVVSFLLTQNVNAEMSSTNYRIRTDSVSFGGSDASSSASYIERGSVGGVAGTGSSTSYQVRDGYRGSVYDQIVSLTVAAGEPGVYAAAQSLSGNVVTVADASNFSVGQLIFVVEGVDAAQNTAVGLIESIAGNSITVDSFVSDTGVTIDGVSDRAYRGNGSSLDYGTVTVTAVSHRLIGWTSFVDVPNGFNVYLSENQDLTSGTDTIADVSDGAVTAGSSEFGARSSDTTLSESTFDTQDTAVTSVPQQIASVPSSAARQAKGFVDLRLAAAVGAPTGSYANTLSFIVAPVF